MTLQEPSGLLNNPYWAYAAVNTLSTIDLGLENRLNGLTSQEEESLTRCLNLFEYLTSYFGDKFIDDYKKFKEMNYRIADQAVKITKTMMPLEKDITKLGKQLENKYSSYKDIIQKIRDKNYLTEEDEADAKELRKFLYKVTQPYVNEGL